MEWHAQSLNTHVWHTVRSGSPRLLRTVTGSCGFVFNSGAMRTARPPEGQICLGCIAAEASESPRDAISEAGHTSGKG